MINSKENTRLNTLKQILRLTQHQLFSTLEQYIEKTYTKERMIVDNRKKFIYAIGDIPVLLVAHLDTVHSSTPSDIFYDKEQHVMWSPQGLGADDRAGVYAILYLLLGGLRPHILFTTDEEVGAIGARQMVASNIRPEVNFVIQLDRRGEDESVYYSCGNKEFEAYINNYGFKTNFGTFSDISVLCPHWKIAGVNLSIGYEYEHTKAEFLYVKHMYSTIKKVEKILKNIDVKNDVFEYIPLAGSRSFYDRFDFADVGQEQSMLATNGSLNELCYECFGTFYRDFVIDGSDGGQYCGDCYSKLFTTCSICQKPFKDRTKTHIVCEACR